MQFLNFADLQVEYVVVLLTVLLTSLVPMQTFFSQFRPDALGANVTVISVNGGLNDQSMPGTEAGLDNQYTEVRYAISFRCPQ